MFLPISYADIFLIRLPQAGFVLANSVQNGRFVFCAFDGENFRITACEKFVIFYLLHIPWRVSEDGIKTSFAFRIEYGGEGEVPVEEFVLAGEVADFGFELGRDAVGVAFNLAEVLGGEFVAVLHAVLGPDEGGAPGVVEEAGTIVAAAFDDVVVELFLGADGFRGVVVEDVHLRHGGGEVAEAVPGLGVGEIEGGLAFTGVAVEVAHPAGGVLGVAGDWFVGGVGDAGGDAGGGGAEEGVAALDMVVEEGERLARVHGFEPEGDLAELDGHGVDVHAVYAVGDNFAEGVADSGEGGGVFAGAVGGDLAGEAVGGGDEEVAASAGGVADLEF